MEPIIEKIVDLEGMGTIVRGTGGAGITLSEIVKRMDLIGARLMSPQEELIVRKRTKGKEDCGSTKEYPLERIGEYSDLLPFNYGTFTNFLIEIIPDHPLVLFDPSSETRISLPAECFPLGLTSNPSPDVLRFLFGEEAEHFLNSNNYSCGFRMPDSLECIEKPLNLFFSNSSPFFHQFGFYEFQNKKSYDRTCVRGIIPEENSPPEIKQIYTFSERYRGKPYFGKDVILSIMHDYGI